MIAIATCWPSTVSEGSGTTVSQNRLAEALRLAGVDCKLICTSRFGHTPAEVEERRWANAALTFDGFEAVLGIDGEGWLWARHRTIPYLAFCEAVLADVLPFEEGEAARVLAVQAEWEAVAAQAADAVVARSEFSAGRVAARYGIAPERIKVLPIPFDVDGWTAGLPALEKEPLVLAVGHAYPRKNYAALLEAWPAVVAARSDARLVLVGHGPETSRLETLAADLPSVQMRGHVPLGQLKALYARAQVFCHPSLQENFGIAVVEGLACGAAVLAHRQPALLETAGGLAGTWMVDARRPEDLAHALLEALDGPRGWPATRLEALRRKLDPAAVGRGLATLLASIMRTWGA